MIVTGRGRNKFKPDCKQISSTIGIQVISHVGSLNPTYIG